MSAAGGDFFQRLGYFQGNYFIRSGGWKLVTTWKDDAKNRKKTKWSLYNIKSDPAETKNLSEVNPAKAAELRAAFDAWFKKANEWGKLFDESGVKIENVKQKNRD